MIQHEANIDAPLQNLARWLEIEIEQSTGIPHIITTDDGLRISLSGHPLNDRWIDIDARWVDVTGLLQEHFKVIRFELRELAESRTQVIGTCAIPLVDSYLERLWGKLIRVFAPSGRPQPPAERSKPLTPDAVIGIYYRRHSHDRKITLKQVCEDLGANYASIKVAKVAYDKRRRRKRSD